MSRFIRVAGQTSDGPPLDLSTYSGVIAGNGCCISNLNTDWEYIYHCNCFCTCVNSITFEVPFCCYHRLKLIVNNLCECLVSTASQYVCIPYMNCALTRFVPQCTTYCESTPHGGGIIYPSGISYTISGHSYTEYDLYPGVGGHLKYTIKRNQTQFGYICVWDQGGVGIMCGTCSDPFNTLTCFHLCSTYGLCPSIHSSWSVLGQRKRTLNIGEV